MDIVKAAHMQKVRTLGYSIEKVRGKLKKNISNREMFDMDGKVFNKTEDKKKIMAEKHKKKLKYRKQLHTREKSSDAHKKEQKKDVVTVITKRISSGSTQNLP